MQRRYAPAQVTSAAALKRDAGAQIVGALEDVKRASDAGDHAVQRFLQWYDILDGVRTDDGLSKWASTGVPIMRAVLAQLDAHRRRVELAYDKRAASLVQSGAANAEVAAALLNPIYADILRLDEHQSRFVGCDESVSAWFQGVVPYVRPEALAETFGDELRQRCVAIAQRRPTSYRAPPDAATTLAAATRRNRSPSPVAGMAS